MSTGRGDVDGDHRPDALASYLLRRTGGGYTVRLAVGLASGATLDDEVARLAPDDLVLSGLYGVADLDGLGGNEILFVSDLAASAVGLGVVRLTNGVLERVVVNREDGETFPISLSDGAAISHGVGFRCADRTGDQHPELLIVSFLASFDKPRALPWYETSYVWKGASLTELRQRKGVLRSDDWGTDERKERYYGAHCSTQLFSHERVGTS